ncbi:MAG TPA: M28 family peptidase [Gemmatimonadaceae bacterium]|nr:M28 family peptidase [Gemmatimonadaceae bacterium]
MLRTPSLSTALLTGACVLCTTAPQTTLAQAARTQRAPAAGRTVWPDEGPKTWAPRPTSAPITANDLRTRLYQFADDSMQGRRIGEPGNAKGTDYIAREFKRLGLKPAGDSGTYFQVLPFGPVAFDSAASRLSVRGAALRAKQDWIPMTPSAPMRIAGTANVENVPTVFAGQWGDTSVTLDAALLRGKVAVFRAPRAAQVVGAASGAPVSFLSCDARPDMFGAAAVIAAEASGRAPSRRAVGGGGVRDTRAQDAGAVAVLLVGLETTAPATINAAFAARPTMRPVPVTNGIGVATISSAVASQLFGGSAEQLTVGAVGAPVSASWTYAWKPSAAPARNVVAILPGSDPSMASEYVLVGAHNDHIGTSPTAVDHDSLRAVNTVTRPQGANDGACQPTAAQQQRIDSLLAAARRIRPARRDSIFNGADDDGSGTVVLLEIAEQFAAEKPKRSIIFVSHQGEEGGLLGSAWFVDHPTVPLTSIVAAHNMDMLGKGRVDQVKFGGPASVQTLGARRLSREFGDIIDSVNATRAEVMAIDKSWDVTANPLNRFCRSDQVNYVRKDVPVTYFSLGYAQDYHQLTDEPQYIEYEHSARLGRFIHDVMMAIAMRKDRPAIAGPDPSYPQCAR